MADRLVIRTIIPTLILIGSAWASAQEPGTLKWSHALPFPLDVSPAMARDGTIYVGDYWDHFWAINPDGTLKWMVDTDDYFEASSPSVAPDGTVYVADAGETLYAFNPDGTVKWTFDAPNQDRFSTTPVIGSDGTIYVGVFEHWITNLYAINPDGTLKWSALTGDEVTAPPSIGSDGTIYVASYSRFLEAFRPDGSLIWQFEMGDSGWPEYNQSAPAIGPDGVIYLGGGDWDDPAIFAVNPNGTLRWRFDTYGQVTSSPAIGSDGAIYVGDWSNQLYAINPDGTLRWLYPAGAQVNSSPAIGSDGTIYVGSGDEFLHAINPDGTRQWRQPGARWYSSPAIGPDGTVYIAGVDRVNAFYSSSNSPANTTWPMYRQNARHTGAWDHVVTPLEIGATVQTTIPLNGVHYYSLETTAVESLLVSVDPGAGSARLGLYGQLGATTYSSETPNPMGRYELNIAQTVDGRYLLTVFGTDVAANGGQYTLVADYVDRHLSDLSLRAAGNSGEVMLDITGLGFDEPMTVELLGPENISALVVSGITSSRLQAVFDLAGVTVGTYDLRVTWPDMGSLTMPDAFEVFPGLGPQLAAELHPPEEVRSYRTYVVWLEYANTGDADMPAPLFTVRGNVPVSLDRADISRDRVEVLGIGSPASPGTLRVGESGRVPIYFTANLAGTVELELSTTIDSPQPINWATYQDLMRPPDMDPGLWDALWPNLVARLGPTWSDYLQVLRSGADRTGLRGQMLHDVAHLLRLEMLQAAGLPDTAVSGTLRHATGNQLLPGVTLRLRALDGSVVIQSETSYAPPGRFVFEEVPDGNYEIWVDGYVFDHVISVNVSGSDVVGLELVADDIPQQPGLPVPEVAQHGPRMTSDGAGTLYMVWEENEQIGWAVDPGSGWSMWGSIPNALGSRPVIAYDAGLFDAGMTPGVFVAWESATSDQPTPPLRIQWSVGRIEPGGIAWSEPQDLTGDGFDDTGSAVVVDDAHAPVVVWMQRDFSLKDDTDLYYLIVNLGAEAETAPWFSGDSATGPMPDFCVGFDFTPGTDAFPDIPLIGGKYELGLAASCCGNIDCTSALAWGGAVNIKTGDGIDITADGTVQNQWVTMQCPCSFVLDATSAQLTLSSAVALAELKKVILVYGIPVASFSIKPIVTAALGGTLTWKSNFPAWPDEGDVSYTVGLGGEGEAKLLEGLLGGKVTLIGEVQGKFAVPDPGPGVCLYQRGPWCFMGYCVRLETTASALYELAPGLAVSWKKGWGPSCPPPIPVTSPFAHQTSSQDIFRMERMYFGEGLEDVPIYEVLEYIKDPTPGTGSVYEGLPLLGDISADVWHDRVPHLARSGSGEILVVWAKDEEPTLLGSRIWVAEYAAGVWGTAETVTPSVEFHKDPAIAFDSGGDPMMVWASALNDGLDYVTSPVEDLVNAQQMTDLVYSRRTGGVWSAPATLATLDGSDTQIAMAAGPSGELAVSWLNALDGLWTVYASIWNGSAWSVPNPVAATPLAAKPTLAYRGSTPIVVWAQDDDSDLDTSDDWKLYSSTWNGSAWTEPQPAGLSLTDESAVYGTGSPSPEGIIPLPDPPAHCCTASCDDPIPADPPADQQEELDSESTPIIFSIDPNEKTGPAGLGPEHFIDSGDRLDYLIYFENLPTATAPAQEVFVTDCLDHDLDWTSVTLDDVAFGGVIVGNPGTEPLFETRITIADYRPGESKEWWVEITSEFDLGTGCLDVTFRTLDPDTGELPEDVFAGFLPPEDGTGRGQGHISLSVDSKADLVDGTVITNRGTIIFDINESIVTNEVFNTIGGPLEPVLTVNLAGPGNGVVTSDPPGIDCGVDCTEAYPVATVVDLEPTPEPDSEFVGWSGDPDCIDGSVTMDGDRSCTATFDLLPSLPFSDGFESGDTSAWSRTVPQELGDQPTGEPFSS